MGNGVGWSSPALPNIACKYNETNKEWDQLLPPINQTMNHCLDKDEQKWVGSLLCIGALIASQVKILKHDIKTQSFRNINFCKGQSYSYT